VEHTVDVDGMLDRMSPELFDEWCAKDEVEPIGYSSRMLGLIAFQLAAYMAGEKAKDVDGEDFMPWTKYQTEAVPAPANSGDFINAFRSALGQA